MEQTIYVDVTATTRENLDHLDDKETLRSVVDVSLLSVQNTADVLSASGTQTALLGNGYVKK